MLKKSFRLSNVKGVRGAKTFTSPFLVVKFAESGDSQTKFAFVVSKAVDKRAVVRNELKRNLSMATRDCLAELKEGYNIIIITKSRILELDKVDQRNILKEALVKANLLK
jgi:ribonuclease P protein component